MEKQQPELVQLSILGVHCRWPNGDNYTQESVYKSIPAVSAAWNPSIYSHVLMELETQERPVDGDKFSSRPAVQRDGIYIHFPPKKTQETMPIWRYFK